MNGTRLNPEFVRESITVEKDRAKRKKRALRDEYTTDSFDSKNAEVFGKPNSYQTRKILPTSTSNHGDDESDGGCSGCEYLRK